MKQQILERFEALTGREKLIVGVTLLAAVWGCVDNFLLTPAHTKQQQLKQQISTLKMQLSTSKSTAEKIQQHHRINPNQSNQQQLKTIKSKIAQLREQINIGEKIFVTPQMMTTVLRDVLKHHQLKLIKLETIPVTNLSNSEHQHPWVFRHGLIMTFSGSYFATLKYLQSLESMPWRFYWDNINYQVKNYPIAEVTIQVYTLSFHEEWLGV